MAHDFRIGIPAITLQTHKGEETIETHVEPAQTPPGEEPVHEDEWEVERDAGSGRRCPSFRCWDQVIDDLYSITRLWYRIREFCTEHRTHIIPVSAYIDELPEVEDEALTILDETDSTTRGGVERIASAQRALWLCRWSQYAYEQHGELSAMESREPLEFRHSS